MTAQRVPSDTAPEALAVLTGLYARMTPIEKVRRMLELTETASRLALMGLRRRHSGASERELLLRLAALRLGEDAVARAYGWRPPAREP